MGAPSSAIDRLVGLGDIRQAAALLRGVATRTPLVPFGPPERLQFLKAESLQPTGAFKLRGAYVAVASLPPEVRAQGVIEPEEVAEAVVAGLADERFLILPHPEVGEYFRRKADDYPRWLGGMQRLQARFR